MAAPTGTTNQIPNSNQDSFHKVLYTKSIDQSGWLRIDIKGAVGATTVPEFVKVAVTEEEKAGRCYFLVLEGVYKGKIASLSVENKKKCLIDVKRGSGAKLHVKIIGRKMLYSDPRGETRNQLVSKLSFDNKSATITLDSDVNFVERNPMSPHRGQVLHSKPIPKGTYKIKTPEAGHDPRATNFYVDFQKNLKYHTVWFPVEYDGNYNSSFVHVGNLSDGCVTVYQLDMWNSVYEYLISNRLDAGGYYVGTVTIE